MDIVVRVIKKYIKIKGDGCIMSKQTREQLGVKPGDKIVLKGEVTFARLDKLIEGEDLVKENERRSKIGMIKADRPFRSITIKNPEVVYGAGTPLATFHGQQVYQNKDGENVITLESKSLYPPSYGHLQNGTVVEIEDPQKNPATGQIVYLLIEAYEVKGFSNMGSTFNAIIFEEGPINFYEGASSSAIKGFGEVMNMPVQPLNNTQPVVKQDGNAFGGNVGGFGQAEVPTQDQNQGQGFGQPAQTQSQGFGQPTQTQQGQPNNNPFGIQDSDVAGNTGQPANSPFA